MGNGDEALDKKLVTYQMSDDLFKASAMDVSLNLDKISLYAHILFMRSWLLFKINDKEEFVTSDDPILIMNSNSLDVTPFKNGLAKKSTIVFYPLTSKLLIAMYSPDMLFGGVQNYDGTLNYIDGHKEQRFIKTINKKQLEHSYRQVYSHSTDALEALI